ncbi:pentapeptide repeat-containing protein [Pararhodobacter sp.]|uniref:pentapeptide repeat-containing protein n=1 Tax=Pararhodobacter sp. TaxID=2127056 RepID=UPI002AFDD887|nr:pentapeptide repeat-containing protein [Pararhodobacter sp.]
MPKTSHSNTLLLHAIEADHGCTGQDLSGVDFERISSDDELSFTDCKIIGARLKGDALIASRWTNCQFRDCTFAMTNLREVQFTDCSFYNSTEVKGSVFQHCTLSRAVFRNCDLTLTRFKGCEAYEIAFTDCQMRGVNFDGTSFAFTAGRRTLNAARFTDCRLTDALLDRLDLNSCHFTDCDMTGTALNGARLVNAVLKDCDLIAPELLQADFSGADLGGSRLDGFNLPELRSYAAMTVSASQQHFLLRSLGIEVTPD